MSNLFQHIAKYKAEKAIDVIEILIFAIGLWWLSTEYTRLGTIWVIGITLVWFIVFIGMSHITTRLLTKWHLPEMNPFEQTALNLLDTVMKILVFLLIAWLAWDIVARWFLLIALILLFIWTEWRKWK